MNIQMTAFSLELSILQYRIVC